MTRMRHRRGFTILETIMVLVIVAIVSAASFAWYGNASSPDKDATAKTSLLAFVEMQQQYFTQAAMPADQAKLSTLDYTRSWVVGPSTGPQEVSVAVVDTVALAAANSSMGVCWFVRMDLVPTPVSPPIVWYADNVDVESDCDASLAAGFTIPDTSSSDIGTLPGKPVTL